MPHDLLVSTHLNNDTTILLKEINLEYSLEGLKLKLQLESPDRKSRLIGKDPDAGEN